MCRTHRRSISLGFSDERVMEGNHICYLYNDDPERRRVMAKYLESGLLEGEKVLYLVDTMTPAEMLAYLEGMGIDVLTKAENLTIADAVPAYCPSSVFNADEMLDAIRDFYIRATEEQGYPGARGTGEMSWCLVEGRAEEASLMDYEARLNLLVREYPYTACCQYDTRRFSGTMIMDVLSVHPVMIVRGQLVRNPYYIEPAVFLQEYRSRMETAGTNRR
jgi:hypothetical protein